MKRISIIIISIISLFTFFSCATILTGSKQGVGISSSPSNAKVSIDGRYVGTTPLSLKLKRNDNHVIKINLKGYQPYQIQVTKGTNFTMFAGDVILTGLIGLAVDYADGDIYALTPNNITATLGQSSKMSLVNKKDKLLIAIVMKPNKNWKKIGQLKRSR